MDGKGERGAFSDFIATFLNVCLHEPCHFMSGFEKSSELHCTVKHQLHKFDMAMKFTFSSSSCMVTIRGLTFSFLSCIAFCS